MDRRSLLKPERFISSATLGKVHGIVYPLAVENLETTWLYFSRHLFCICTPKEGIQLSYP
jgi:hypothetical protein